MKEFICSKTVEIKLEIVGYPNYVVAGNRIYNKKTGRMIRKISKGGIYGYCLNSKFVRSDSLQFKRPDFFDVPF